MLFELGVIVGLIALLIYLFNLYLHSNDNYWTSRGVPLVLGKEVATFWELMSAKKTLFDMDQGFYDKFKGKKYGGTMELVTPNPVFYVMDLDLIKTIFIKDFDYFVDRREIGGAPEDALHDQDKFFVNMLPSLKGQKWKDVRSILSPTFTTSKIKRMFKHFNQCAEGILEFVKSQSTETNGKYKVIVNDIGTRYAVDVIGATAFGMETYALRDPNSIFFKMYSKLSEINMKKIAKTLFLVMSPKLGKRLGLKLINEEVWQFFSTTLRQANQIRENSQEKRDDFLQLMIESKKGDLKTDEGELDTFEKEAQIKPSEENKGPKFVLTDDLAHAQSFMFFMVGLDGVASLVNFAAYIMAVHPDIQDKLYEEVKDCMEAGEGEIDYDSVAKLKYMDMVISEILRVYPAATRIERKCTKDYVVADSGLKIEKDVLVAVNVQAIHHDPEYYPNPEKFDPERFSPEEKAKRHPFAYLPWGAGPRNCIGMRFALMEAKVAIAYLAYNFLIEPTEKTPIPIKKDQKIGTNKPIADLELQFTIRKH